MDVPPFPPLAWDESCWTGEDTFPAWAGFQTGDGRASDGSALVNVYTADDEEARPAPAQAAAYGHLIDHQDAVRDAVLHAVASVYPEWQTRYGYDAHDARHLMPDLDGPGGLRALTELTTVNVFSTEKEGVAYVGLQFACTWDDEHALGAMTHIGRVVRVGGADTAILEWIADEDAEEAS